mmetsp:Transcript_5662/g.14139  ORF Transcript_5662/g.14139 Transcript_5662/m.14139 type:complete len:447 (+) Transcript_5662:312-1652(+)
MGITGFRSPNQHSLLLLQCCSCLCPFLFRFFSVFLGFLEFILASRDFCLDALSVVGDDHVVDKILTAFPVLGVLEIDRSERVEAFETTRNALVLCIFRVRLVSCATYHDSQIALEIFQGACIRILVGMSVGSVLETNGSPVGEEIVEVICGVNVVMPFRFLLVVIHEQVGVSGTARSPKISSVVRRIVLLGLVPVRLTPPRLPIAPFVPRRGRVDGRVGDSLEALSHEDGGMEPRAFVRDTFRGSFVDLRHRAKTHLVRSASMRVVVDLVDDVANLDRAQEVPREHLVHVRQDRDVVGLHAQFQPAVQYIVALCGFAGEIRQLGILVDVQPDLRFVFGDAEEPSYHPFVFRSVVVMRQVSGEKILRPGAFDQHKSLVDPVCFGGNDLEEFPWFRGNQAAEEYSPRPLSPSGGIVARQLESVPLATGLVVQRIDFFLMGRKKGGILR